MRRARHIPLVLLMVVARSLGAQWQASVDLGASRLEQTGIPESNAQTLGVKREHPSVAISTRRQLLTARTSGGSLDDASTRRGVVVRRARSRVQWELSGSRAFSGETNAQTASSAEVIARGYYGHTRGSGSSLALGGGTRRADAGRQPLGRAIANAWTSNLAGRFAARAVARTHDDDADSSAHESR